MGGPYHWLGFPEVTPMDHRCQVSLGTLLQISFVYTGNAAEAVEGKNEECYLPAAEEFPGILVAAITVLPV